MGGGLDFLCGMKMRLGVLFRKVARYMRVGEGARSVLLMMMRSSTNVF